MPIFYLKKEKHDLYDNINNNDDNIFNLYAFAYIKTYIYSLVAIDNELIEKCNFHENNALLYNDNDEPNSILDMIINCIIILFFKNTKHNNKFQIFNF